MAHIEICGGESTKPKNTGFKDQCLETKLQIPVISNGHQFTSIEDFKTRASWKSAIKDKKLVPLFEVYELADASTEDTVFESGNFRKTTAKGAEIITFECYISICAYESLKSYEDSGNYNELFEFNEGGDYSGILTSDGKVRGRKIKSIRTRRIRATNDKIPYVSVEITYADRDEILETVLVKSELSATDLVGIFDVQLVSVSASATSIKFKVVSGCAGGTLINSLISTNFKLRNTSGEVVSSTSFVAADSNGVYEITGTNFANNFTLEVDGVAAVGDVFYEGTEKLTISIP